MKAVTDAGYEVARVEIGRDGKIIIVPTRAAVAGTVEKNPWDEARWPGMAVEMMAV